MGLATNTDYATEVTLQPLERYPLDAAILFSDILTVPDAMGLGLRFALGEGPRFAHPVRDEADVARLEVPDMDKLRYVFDAVSSIRGALTQPDGKSRVPLIGFAGSPWTLATYMIEGGGGDHDFKRAKSWVYGETKALHQLLEVVTTSVISYLKAQREAGVDALMVFDTWGGALAAEAYRECSLQYMARIVSELGDAVPTILFTKGGGSWLESIADTGCSAVGLDWTVPPMEARRRIGHRVALQGNLDPAVLRAPIPVIEQEGRVIL
jgi:uroporphyrinogen decarboxylase